MLALFKEVVIDGGAVLDSGLYFEPIKDLFMSMGGLWLMDRLLFRTLGLLDTRIGLTVIYMLMNLPIVVWMLYTFFKEVPKDILEAGRMDGANQRDEIRHLLLPLAMPGAVRSGLTLNLGHGPNRRRETGHRDRHADSARYRAGQGRGHERFELVGVASRKASV